ncbi:MAG: hypothetical protein QXS76_00160 [Candidatus Bathyarchaeia archaeon]
MQQRGKISELRLEGFLVSTSSPSEEQLRITVDCTDVPWERFGQLIRDLQDQLSEIDLAYAAQERIRGRKILGGHRKDIWANKRTKTIRFSPFPSRFSNLLKNLRKERYSLIHAHGICLTPTGEPFERNIYLLSAEGAEEFLKEVEALNERLALLQREVDAFQRTEHFELIMRSLEEAGASFIRKPFSVGSIRVNLTPIRIDPTAIEEWIEKSPRVARAIKEAEQEILKSAIESFQRRLDPIIRGEFRKISTAKRKLKELEELTRQLGLEALRASVIVPLYNAIDNPKAYVLAKVEASERMKAFIASL